MKIKHEYLIIFWTVLSSGSVLFQGFYYETFFVFILLVLLFIFFFKESYSSIKYITAILFLSTIVLLTMIGNSDFEAYLSYYNFILRILVAACLPLLIGFKEFREKYVKIVVFLAFTSLVTYSIANIAPQIITLFPVIRGLGEVQYHNLFFSVIHYPVYNISRNNGIFWEPGAFQAFLNLAIFFEVEHNNFKHSKRLLFLIAALATTFSTTGYIVFIIIMFVAFFNKSKRNVIVLLISLLFMSTIGLSLIKEVVVDKFSVENYSYFVRYVSTLTDLLIFSESPIIGVGKSNYSLLVSEYSLNNFGIDLGGSVNSLTNYLSVYGGLFCFTLLYFYLIAVIKFTKSFIHRVIYFFLLLVIFATENFLTSFLWLSIAFYGLISYSGHHRTSRYSSQTIPAKSLIHQAVAKGVSIA